ERVEVRLGVHGRLAYHAVSRLRAVGELDADAAIQAAFSKHPQRNVKRAGIGRTRIARVVAGKGPDVARPRVALGVAGLRFDYDQGRVALARKNRGVISLHAPVISQVKNVVGSA